jgi:metallo-beta-lactamase class B
MLLSALLAASAAQAQQTTLAEQERPADDCGPLAAAANVLLWPVPQKPFHIAGPLYYVGTKGLASYLFSTSDGLILLNTGGRTSGPMIAQSIKTLGFDPKDIRIIINGHGHFDHAGGFAYIKKLSGAELAIMEGDVAIIKDGGRSDFHYGKYWPLAGQRAVDVDRVLKKRKNGDPVTLGNVTLTAFNTPGHTLGATTWVTDIVEGGKTYHVVFPDGAGVNPGYHLTGDKAEYPGIADDFRDTHRFLATLRPDMWFAFHTDQFDFRGKYARMAKEGAAVWVDPKGYRQFIASKKRALDEKIAREGGAKPKL